ncbi:MAG: 50S ribosomal protein L13 [Candidatus Woesearchaeota archaeon]
MKIDASNLLVGRFATVAAKSALLGETVEVINCEKAVISGSREQVLQEWLRKSKMGTHRKGPFYIRQPDRIVKRIIRGMLPHRQPKGAAALKRIRCFTGIPSDCKKDDFKQISGALCSKLQSTRFVTVGEISKTIGGK